jgi:effector-binding domain-containing protein
MSTQPIQFDYVLSFSQFERFLKELKGFCLENGLEDKDISLTYAAENISVSASVCPTTNKTFIGKPNGLPMVRFTITFFNSDHATLWKLTYERLPDDK